MKISPYGIALIKHFEGCRLKPYLDAVNLWTIGWGKRITAIQVKQYWGGVSQEQVDKWFEDDSQHFAEGVSKLLTRELPQHMFDPVVCLVYNIGLGAFEKSHIRQYLNEGKFQLARGEFQKWCHAGSHVLPGLQKRRQIEQHAFDLAPTPGETVHDYITFVCGQG